MNARVKIMIVDDEPNIVEVARLYLEHAGFEPVILYNGGQVVDTVLQQEPALIILDVMLPDLSGFKVCERIRSLPAPHGKVPIVLLTAKGEAFDKLRGFNLGIDDYIVKPFDPNELIARVKAVLRRTYESEGQEKPAPSAEESRKILQSGGLQVDLDQYKVTVNGQRADLTPKEIELLYFLAANPGRVYTRDDLLMQVWNFDFGGGTRTVDAHVKNLRKKLGAHPDWNIQTLWGIGYSFEVTGHA